MRGMLLGLAAATAMVCSAAEAVTYVISYDSGPQALVAGPSDWGDETFFNFRAELDVNTIEEPIETIEYSFDFDPYNGGCCVPQSLLINGEDADISLFRYFVNVGVLETRFRFTVDAVAGTVTGSIFGSDYSTGFSGTETGSSQYIENAAYSGAGAPFRLAVVPLPASVAVLPLALLTLMSLRRRES